jgi:phi13 family phage major tail protein
MANSRTGAEKLTVAKILTDVAGGATTYDTPYEFTKKLMMIGVKEDKASEKQFADDQTVDIYSEDGDITVDIDVTDLTEDEKAMLLGQTMAAGVRTPSPNDVRPYFCVMWKGKKRNKAYKFNKVLKVQFSEPDESYETQKGASKPQTDKFTGTGIQRLSDGIRKRIADENSTTWVPATGTDWFTTGDITPDVTPPTVTSVPVDGASGVALAATIVWTFSKAIQAALMTGANFFVTTAAGVAKAGALSINTLNTIVTFTPTTPLVTGTTYIAVVTTNVKDLSGNALAVDNVIDFATV